MHSSEQICTKQTIIMPQLQLVLSISWRIVVVLNLVQQLHVKTHNFIYWSHSGTQLFAPQEFHFNCTEIQCLQQFIRVAGIINLLLSGLWCAHDGCQLDRDEVSSHFFSLDNLKATAHVAIDLAGYCKTILHATKIQE